jgi:hypothetical protein
VAHDGRLRNSFSGQDHAHGGFPTDDSVNEGKHAGLATCGSTRLPSRDKNQSYFRLTSLECTVNLAVLQIINIPQFNLIIQSDGFCFHLPVDIPLIIGIANFIFNERYSMPNTSLTPKTGGNQLCPSFSVSSFR